MPSFHEQDDGRTVETGVGEEFAIGLPENPTAGFRWRLARDGGPVCALRDEVFDPGRQAPGQPGMHHWRFQVVAAGVAAIELAYRRAWEAAPGAARTFVLHVSAKKERAAKPASAARDAE